MCGSNGLYMSGRIGPRLGEIVHMQLSCGSYQCETPGPPGVGGSVRCAGYVRAQRSFSRPRLGDIFNVISTLLFKYRRTVSSLTG